MDSGLFHLVILGLLAAAGNVLGGLILFPARFKRDYRRFLKYLLALGAGFMLAVTFIEILPRSIDIWLNYDANRLYLPMLLVLGGYMLTQFFEHTIAPHMHLGEELDSEELISPGSAYTAIGGLVIHTFFDGVSIAAASQLDFRAGLLVFLAVFLHKFPEGFTIGSLVMAAGKDFRQVIVATSLVGLTTVLGVVVFYIAGSTLDNAVAYALPIAGGITLYVAASDLIPEANHHGGKSPFISLSVFAGVALFFLVHTALNVLLEPH
ncbi:MAG: ZIP family metal transporter [Pyrinomonadaceae bacterium]